MALSIPDRDRRADGRPEQARPRDRTGRPLRAQEAVGIPLCEDHDPASVEEALVLGQDLWEQRRYFEAHECLEHVWHAAPEADRDLWQGVIQVAVAAVHVQRDNPDGALALLSRAGMRLEGYPPVHRGIDVAVALATCRRLAAEVAAGEAVALPDFPAAPGGPWFTPDAGRLAPPATPTPISDEPAWRRTGVRRAPRQRTDNAPPPPSAQEGGRSEEPRT